MMDALKAQGIDTSDIYLKMINASKKKKIIIIIGEREKEDGCSQGSGY